VAVVLVIVICVIVGMSVSNVLATQVMVVLVGVVVGATVVGSRGLVHSRGIQRLAFVPSPHSFDVHLRIRAVWILLLLSIGISKPLGSGGEDPGWLFLASQSATNEAIYQMAVEFLVANAFVYLIFEIIECLGYAFNTIPLEIRREKLTSSLKTLNRPEGQTEDKKSWCRGMESMNPDNYFRLSNIVDLFDIFSSFALGYFDIGCVELFSCSHPDGWSWLGRKTMRASVFMLSWRNVCGSNYAWAEIIAHHVLPILRSFDALGMLLVWTIGVWLMFSQLLYLSGKDR
jgi:hypothetical protein